MFCSNCKKEENGKYCSNCGSVLEESNSVIVEPPEEGLEFNFSARKIGARAIKVYTTNVKINGENITVVNSTNPETVLQAHLEDVVSVKRVVTPIINKIDIFRFILAFVLMFIPAPPVLYGLFAFAFFYYYTLIKTLKITLKDGRKIKVYYKNQNDLVELEEILNRYL